MTTRAYIGLGSNLGDSVHAIYAALAALEALPGVCALKHSALYRSRPLGPPGQADYVNAVAAIDTVLSVWALFAALQAEERRQGRRAGGVRWGPRCLDLDLLLFGEAQIQAPLLTVPHPGLAERDFVLRPLAEIAPPGLQVPGQGVLEQLIARCPAHYVYAEV